MKKYFYNPKKGDKIRILPYDCVVDLHDESIRVVSKSYFERVKKNCPICDMGIEPKKIIKINK